MLIYESYLENYHLSKPNIFGRVEEGFEFIHIDVKNEILVKVIFFVIFGPSLN
jgi:hypothetical protein